MTQSKFQNRLKVVSQIKIANNSVSEEELKQLLIKYHQSKNCKIIQLDIRYGPGSGKKYQDLLLEKAKYKASFGRLEFWTNKGYTLDEAQRIKTEHFTKLNKKRSELSLEAFKKDPKKKEDKYKKVKKTKDERKKESYWLAKGFSSAEAQKKIQNYNPPKHDLQSFIQRYGEISGSEKYKQICLKRKESRIKKFGRIFDNPGVSKMSLNFFKPLYKLLRKSGIKKEDIMWGIKGKREFTTKDPQTKNNYSYDFTILSKKLIIEFNDPFWHARNGKNWRNPFMSFSESLEKDKHKLEVARRLGFDIIYVWSDNLPDTNELKEIIINHEL